jgi:hypothetical protein
VAKDSAERLRNPEDASAESESEEIKLKLKKIIKTRKYHKGGKRIRTKIK